MKYMVCWKLNGAEPDYTVNGEEWEAALVEFAGRTEEAVKHYTRMVLYYGDEDGKPEDYDPQYELGHHDAVAVLVFAVTAGHEGDIHQLRKELNDYHRRNEKKLQDERERAEYERLKRKFEGER